MRISCVIGVVLASVILLSGCSSQTPPPDDTVKPQTNSVKPKNPDTVSLYNQATITPATQYKVIGSAEVSMYNFVGIKRQTALVNDKLRELAASIGGDAVINIKQKQDMVTGTIVAYQDV